MSKNEKLRGVQELLAIKRLNIANRIGGIITETDVKYFSGVIDKLQQIRES